MGHSKACKQCRESKRRCLDQGSEQPCVSCARRRVVCTFSSFRPSQTLPSTVQLSPRALEARPQAEPGISRDNAPRTPSLSSELAVELTEHYLEKIHDRPHSLFHPATLRQQVRDGSVNMALLHAICSMGSRFSVSPIVRSLELTLLNESKRLLLADIENICVENIQCCVLVANLVAAQLNPTSEALFFRIANGMAQILRLNSSDTEGSLLECEIRRRVWWTLIMGDRWASSGLGLQCQLDELGTTINLPMDEAVFASLTSDQKHLSSQWTPGLWAHMIVLVRLLGPIHDLNSRCARGQISAEERERSTVFISRQLENWENLLPLGTKLNEGNMEAHLNAGTGGAFVALHLGYHHYSTLLYFQFLEREKAASDQTKVFISKCKAHASAYSSLLQRSCKDNRCRALYPTVGHMAVVSSSVLVHTLLFGDMSEISKARQELNSNFEAIVELQQYWSNSGFMFNRLVTFQNSCLMAEEQNPHHLDGWMVRFLQEHSLPLHAKDPAPVVSLSPGTGATLSIAARQMHEQGRYTDFDLTALRQQP